MIAEFAIQCGATVLNGVGADFINHGEFDEAKTQSAAIGKKLVSAIGEHKPFPEQEELR
jgi:hypothetical protein